jgi:hypothetical protein
MTTVDPSARISGPLAVAPATGSDSPDDSGFSFGDLLDIVNPLQHIPIVSTIYRAISGDQIKTFPKIAGDALFGGVAGFISSVADTLFEKITGKTVGDTVLAWVEKEISNPPSAITASVPAASTPPALVAPAFLNSIVMPGQDALLTALTRKSVDQELALRAATAYRSSIDIASKAASSALH